MSGVAAGSPGWRTIAQSAVAVVAPADTNENVLATVTIPANSMGPNGTLRITSQWSATNNANVKNVRIRLGGAAGTLYMNVATTSTVTYFDPYREISNRGAANSQIGMSSGSASSNVTGTGGAAVTSAADTTADTTVVFQALKATAGDAMALEKYRVEVNYGA